MCTIVKQCNNRLQTSAASLMLSNVDGVSCEYNSVYNKRYSKWYKSRPLRGWTSVGLVHMLFLRGGLAEEL